MKRIAPPLRPERGGRGRAHRSSPAPLFLRLFLQVDDQSRTTVETARLFASVVVLRTLFAVAHRGETRLRHAPADQIVADRVGSAIAEREVVFGRADVAGVTFDL